MTTKLIVVAVCIYGGLWLGALISELSLRGESVETQGRLMKRLAPLRLFHLVGFPALLVLGFNAPRYAPVALLAYFSLAIALVWLRLRTDGFPPRLVILQMTSTATLFLGVALAAVAGYVL